MSSKVDKINKEFANNKNNKATPWATYSESPNYATGNARMDKIANEFGKTESTPKTFGTNSTATPWNPVNVHNLTPQQYYDNSVNAYNVANQRSATEYNKRMTALNNAVAFNNSVLPQMKAQAYSAPKVTASKTYDPATKASKEKERETVNQELNILRERVMGGDTDPTLSNQIAEKNKQLADINNTLYNLIDYNLDPKQYGAKFDEMAQKGALVPGNPLTSAKFMATGSGNTMGVSYDKSAIYRYTMMTPDEQKLYNAFYAEDPMKAEAYLDSISVGNIVGLLPGFAKEQIIPNVAERAGMRAYQDVPDNFFAKSLIELGSGMESGTKNIMGTVDMALGKTGYMPVRPSEYVASEISNNAGTVEKAWYDIMQSTGNMMPGIAVSAATGLPILGDIVFATSQAGGAYRDAIRGGATVSSARKFSVQQGIDEAATNWLLGGISSLGGGALKGIMANSEIGNAVVSGIDKLAKTEAGKKVLGRAMSYLADMGSEAAQEFLQYFTEGFSRELFLGEKFDVDWGEAAYAAALGALNAGLLNIGSPARDIAASTNLNTSYAEAFKDATMPTEEMQTTATDLSKISQDIIDKQNDGKNANVIDRLGRGIAENDFANAQLQYMVEQDQALKNGEIDNETYLQNRLNLAKMNAETTNNTRYEREGVDNVEDSSRGQADRQDDLDRGRGSSSVQSLAEQETYRRAAENDDLRTLARDEKWNLKSATEFSVKNGTDEKITYEIPDEYIAKGETARARELSDIKADAAKYGRKVSFVVGQLNVTEDGETFGVRGVILPNGDMIIRADSDYASATNIYKHEEFHDAKKVNPNIVADTKRRYLNTHSEEELARTLVDYAQTYRYAVFDEDGNFSPEKFAQNKNKILEELLADAYANMPQVTAELDKGVHDIRKSAKREMQSVGQQRRETIAKAEAESKAMALKKAEEEANRKLTPEESARIAREKAKAEKKAKGLKKYEKRGEHRPKAERAAAVNNDTQYSVEAPYRFGTSQEREWADTLNDEAKKTYDMFAELHTIGQKNKASVKVGVGLARHSKTIDVTTRNMLAEEWNGYVKNSPTFKATAMKLAEALPENIRSEVHINMDGTITPTEFENEFKMMRSFMQRVVDALPDRLLTNDKGDAVNYVVVQDADGKDHKIKISNKDKIAITGGEALRRQLLNERRKLYNEFDEDGNRMLKTKSITGLSKDTWGTMGFLATNTKTKASGDFTTFCPQMMFNKGCWYCYRLAALKSNVNNKLVGEKVWYTGEILRLTKENIKTLNSLGGLRIQSFGDWYDSYTPQLLDLLMDADTVGLQVKIITKETGMIDTVALLMEEMQKAGFSNFGKNLYFNLSTDYTIESADADAVINPARPYMYGIMEHDPNDLVEVTKDGEKVKVPRAKSFTKTDNTAEGKQRWWKRALTVEEAAKYRDKYPWVNIRIVATNTDEFIYGLKSPNVDVVTGYHGKERYQERISSETGEVLTEVEPLGDNGMPVFDPVFEKNADGKLEVVGWEFHTEIDKKTGETIVRNGKTKYQKELARKIQEQGLESLYYVKTCCQYGRCADCKGLCGKWANDFNVKNATNRDKGEVAYWRKQMIATPEFYKFASVLTNDEYQAILEDYKDGLTPEELDGYNTTRYSKESPVDKDNKVRFGSMFSGAGTVDFALRNMISNRFAVEYDGQIAGVYKDNNGDEIYVGDVRDAIKSGYIKDQDIDYLHASPVCKNYSTQKADTGELPLDKKTAKAVADAIDSNKPKVVTIENVKGYRKSEAIQIIKDALTRNGYKFDEDVYRASDYGGATSRERYFLRAVKDVDTMPSKPTKTNGKSWYAVTKDLISGLKEMPLKKDGYLNQRWLAIKDKVDTTKPVLLLRGNPNGSVIYAEADEPSPTIIAKETEARIVMPDGRVLEASPRVLARIQGLPDSFKLPKQKTLANRVIGNGIPVQLTQAVAGSLMTEIDGIEDVKFSKEVNRKGQLVGSKELSGRDDIAVYVKDTRTAKYAKMMFAENEEDRKTLETRDNRKLDDFIDKPYEITDGKYVWGKVKFGDPFKIYADEFHSDKYQSQHRVPADKNDKYDVKPGSFKWAYPIEIVERYDEPRKLNPDKEYKWSYQAREVKYSKEVDSIGNKLSENQQQYFNDSKVRDEEGKLRVVYHGTDADFTTFDRSKSRANMDIQGNFFSPYKEDAEGYGKNVKAYYLNITNPADEKTAYKVLNKYKGQNNAGIKAREELINMGYDGVYNGYDEYISFEANQAKLVDNQDPTANDDTRYSKETLGNDYTSSDGKVATFTDERILRDIEDNHYGTSENGEKTLAYVAFINPTEFVKATHPDYDKFIADETSRGNIKDLDTDKLKAEKQTPYLRIELTGKDIGEIIGHEGRHRMVALANAGYDKVAILIKDEDHRYDTGKTSIDSLKLKGQSFWSGDSQPVTVTDVTPMFRENTEYIKSHFGEGGELKFSKEVTDKKTLNWLNKQEKKENITVTYKAMEVGEDGKLYPPMATYRKIGKGRNAQYIQANPGTLGVWQVAEEFPEDIITKGKNAGKYPLYKRVWRDKKNKYEYSLVPAAYDPYEHSSNLMINDQFKLAYARPDVKVVECIIANEDLNSGYQADKAMLAVGKHDWKSGDVMSKIRKQKDLARSVYLTRYIKPVRILGDAEVAEAIKGYLDGTDVEIPYEVLNPGVNKELKKLGVKVNDGTNIFSKEITPEMLKNAKPRYTAEEMDWQIGKTKGIEREKADMRLQKAKEQSNEKIANLKAESKAKLNEVKAANKAKNESQRMALKTAEQEKLDKQKAKYKERLDRLDEKRKNQVEAERQAKLKARAEEHQRHIDYILKKREMKADAKARQDLLKKINQAIRIYKNKPGYSAVQSIINGIDNKSVRLLPTTKEELLKKQAEITSLADQDENFARLHKDRMLTTVARLSQKQISDMNLDDVKELAEVLTELIHYQQTADKLIRDDKKRRVSTLGKAWIDELKYNVPKLNKGSKIVKAWEDFTLNNMSPLRAFRKISGYSHNSVGEERVRAILDGETKRIGWEQKVMKPFEDFMRANKKFMKNSTKQIIPIEVAGQKAMISPAMRISLYMHSMNEDNLKHIASGGITIPVEKLYKKGDYANAYDSGQIVQITPVELDEILKDMTPEEMQYAELLQDFFQEAADAINETSLDLDGVLKAQVENYFPISSNHSFLTSNDGFDADPTLEGWNNLKARINSGNPILLEDATSVLARHISKTAQYYGLAVPLRNMSQVFNYTTAAKADPDNQFSDAVRYGSVKDAMTRTWDAETVDYVNQFIKDVNSGGRRGNYKQYEKLADKLRGAYAGATLTLNPSVALKQTTSYFMAGSILKNSSLAYGLTHKFTKADEAYMDSITPWGWNRRRGQSTIEIGDVAKSNGILSKIPNWNQAMDVITTNALFIATERDVQSQYPDLKRGDAEYDNALAEKYNEVLWRTQPQYDVVFRPEFLRSQSVVAKTLGMFKTESMQMSGELLDAIGQYHADKINGLDTTESKKTFYKTLGSWTASNLSFAALGAVLKFALHNIKGYRDDEGEIDPNMVLKEILSGFVSSSAGGFFGGSAVYDTVTFLKKKATGESATWYDIEVPGISIYNDLVSSSGQLISVIGRENATAEDITKAVTRFALDVSKLTPVGFAENVYKMADAVNLYIQDIKNGNLWSYEGGENLLNLKDTTVTSKQYATRTVNSYAVGNDSRGTDAYNNLINQVGADKAEDKVRSVLREDLKADGTLAYDIVDNSQDENIRGIALKLILDYEKDSKGKPSTSEVIESLNISNADKGMMYAGSTDAKSLKAWRENGGSEYDYYVATQQLAPSIPKEDASGNDVDAILYVKGLVDDGTYTDSQASAWLAAEKSSTKSYEMWSSAGGSDKDYFKAYSEIKEIKAKKLKDDTKKSQIVSIIRGYTKKSSDPETTARALWSVADYSFDSTKDKKKVEDGNFLKALPEFKKAKDLRLKKY